jgi:hypothetical protein
VVVMVCKETMTQRRGVVSGANKPVLSMPVLQQKQCTMIFDRVLPNATVHSDIYN